jgi:hypothetical protein
MYETAVEFGGPLKESSTVIFDRTGFAWLQIDVLPVRNRFPSELPKGFAKNAKLMIVNGNVHSSRREKFNSRFEFFLVVVRIDPQLLHVPWCIADVFETHECNVLSECQIPIYILSQLWEARDCDCMQNYSNLYAYTVSSQLMQAENGLIKSPSGLHDIIVNGRIIGVEWNAKHKIRVVQTRQTS